MEREGQGRVEVVMRTQHGKKPTWDIYLGDELICRLMTKIEAQRVAFLLGSNYRIVKSE